MHMFFSSASWTNIPDLGEGLTPKTIALSSFKLLRRLVSWFKLLFYRKWKWIFNIPVKSKLTIVADRRGEKSASVKIDHAVSGTLLEYRTQVSYHKAIATVIASL